MRYVNPDANFSYIKKVAVLPFNNMSGDRFAGEKVRSAVMIDLLSRGAFDILEQGEVSKTISLVMRAAGVAEGTVLEPDKETLKLLGEKLGVQAIVIGSVEEYEGLGGGVIVSISTRMLDTSSGIILWQAHSSVSGASVWRRILGVEETDKTFLTRKVVRKIIDTLL
ncbi:MAG: hypothetical protein WA162_08515 [Thermodesulfobacteriota bacterium]